jgi:hypothetical protein
LIFILRFPAGEKGYFSEREASGILGRPVKPGDDTVLVSEYRASFEFPVAPPGWLAHYPDMIRDQSENEPAKLPKGVIAVAPPSFRREPPADSLSRLGHQPIAKRFHVGSLQGMGRIDQVISEAGGQAQFE